MKLKLWSISDLEEEDSRWHAHFNYVTSAKETLKNNSGDQVDDFTCQVLSPV